ETHRAALKAYANAKGFSNGFRWTASDRAAFMAMIEEAGIQIPEMKREGSLAYILNDMRALLARQLFDTNAYYMVSNQDDKVLEAALQGLSNYQSLLATGSRK